MDMTWNEISNWSHAHGNKEQDPGLMSDLRVLMVDDAPESRRLYKALLGQQGAQVDEAADGQEGYRKGSHIPYDVVLMDLEMPGWDGFRATMQLRAAGFENPIIALSAHDGPDVQLRCLETGFSDHLAKKLAATALVETVVHWAHLGRKLL